MVVVVVIFIETDRKPTLPSSQRSPRFIS